MNAGSYISNAGNDIRQAKNAKRRAVFSNILDQFTQTNIECLGYPCPQPSSSPPIGVARAVKVASQTVTS